MIATAVLSTLLVLVTVLLIGIGRLYYKGIGQSSTQAAARTIMDDVVQRIRSTSTNVTSKSKAYGAVTVKSYCVGNTIYSYVLNKELGASGGVQHVLWRSTTNDPACTPADLTASTLESSDPNGTELMPPRSRLTQFDIQGNALTPGVYTINLYLAVGEDDQLCDNGNDTHPSDCDSSTPSTRLNNPYGTVLCKSQAGDQFCALASLNSTAVHRL